jgi:nitroreductase
MMLDLIMKRRSIRKYTPEPVIDEHVRALLEAAMAAPTADNLQPWQFVVVRKPELRQKLAKTHPWAGACGGAPVVFVILGDETISEHWVEDASAAMENLLLEVVALNLGSVWLGVYPNRGQESHVRKALGIPDHLRVLALAPVGHPAETKPPHSKYQEGKIHYDTY